MPISSKILRDASIKLGSIQVTKDVTPNYHELELSKRQHRNPKAAKGMIEFFKAAMDEVTEQETDLLRILKFPEIDIIRMEYISGEPDKEGNFDFTPAMSREIDAIFENWQLEMLGSEQIKKEFVSDNDAIYPHYMLQMFGIGVAANDEIFEGARVGASVPMINVPGAAITFSDAYLLAVLRDGASRLRAKLSLKHAKEIKKIIRQMAKEGVHPLTAGRWLHKNVGEGNAWWWKRITRSESALALDAAFDNSLSRFRPPYEYFSAGGGACDMCAYYDGMRFRAGHGVHPVSDTHPSCMCCRRPDWTTPEKIQPDYNRPSPYDVPITPQEWSIFSAARNQ